MEVKIINPNIQEDRDFINNNPLLKDTFEKHIRWKSSPMSSNRIFEKYKTDIFSFAILDNQGIVSMAMGTEYKDDLYISNVYSSVERIGGCTKVIGNLLNYWWDKEKLQFKNNLPVSLGVYDGNIAAIKCYEKYGFKKIFRALVKDPLGNDLVRIKMLLKKGSYAKNYLLPQYTQKLIERQKKN